jgi:hypothetical protein
MVKLPVNHMRWNSAQRLLNPMAKRRIRIVRENSGTYRLGLPPGNVLSKELQGRRRTTQIL